MRTRLGILSRPAHARRLLPVFTLTVTALWLLGAGQAWGASRSSGSAPPKPVSAPMNPVAAPGGWATPGLGHVPTPVPGFHAPRGFSYSPMAKSYASSFDLRTYGKVTPVRDQAGHGTCWVFAGYGSLESCLLTGETWDFSEDNLAYFKGFDGGYDWGGNSIMVAACLTRWGQPFAEADDPYDDDLHPDPSTLTLQKHVQNVIYLPPRTSATDNDTLKHALTTWGAIDVSIYWTSNSAYWNATTNSLYFTGKQRYNHDITVIGWDDNYPASNFSRTPPGNGAFLIKNSWGTSWGDAGYFWISYYDSTFGYDTMNSVFTGAESTANYGSIYQYDPFGYVGSFGFGTGVPVWGANRFTAQSNSQLTALGFWTLGVDTAYELYCGTSLSNLQLKGSGTVTEMGYHTVALSSPVSLTASNDFYVAVKLTTPGHGTPMAKEFRYPGYCRAASANTNESFYSSNGSTWTDFTSYQKNANVCIKAYTAAPAGRTASPSTPWRR